MKPNLSKDVSIENIINSLFINNKDFISIESDSLGEVEKGIIEKDEEIYDPYDTIYSIHKNLSDAKILSFSIRTLEKCSKSKENLSIPNGDLVSIIDNDVSKKEYEETIIKTKDDNLSSYTAAIAATESEIDDNIINNFSQKFWGIIGEILHKVNKALLFSIKRIHSYIYTNFKHISIWYMENGERCKDKIINDENFRMVVKIPETMTINDFQKDFLNQFNIIFNSLTEIDIFYRNDFFTKNSIDDIGRIDTLLTLSETTLKISQEWDIKEMKKMLFKDRGIRSITSKEFFGKFDYECLDNSSKFDDYMNDIRSTVSLLSSTGDTVKKAAKRFVTNNIIRDKINNTFVNYETTINNIVSSYIWLISYRMYLTNTAFKFCKLISTPINK